MNLVKDATGVEATVNGTTLELTSTNFGSDEFVDVEVISENAGGSIVSGLGDVTKTRDAGSDIVATINGTQANGKGNELSINTATLDFSATIESVRLVQLASQSLVVVLCSNWVVTWLATNKHALELLQYPLVSLVVSADVCTS